MKKVKILLDLPKTIDGESIGPFAQGLVCDLDDDVAEKFLNSAMADVYTGPADGEPASGKVAPGSDNGAAEAARAADEGEARRLRRMG